MNEGMDTEMKLLQYWLEITMTRELQTTSKNDTILGVMYEGKERTSKRLACCDFYSSYYIRIHSFQPLLAGYKNIR